MSKIKNTLEGINSSVEDAEEQNSDLEDGVMKSQPNQTAKWKKNNKKNGNRLRELGDIIKYNKIHIIGIPEGKESEREGGKLIWRKNSWKLY